MLSLLVEVKHIFKKTDVLALALHQNNLLIGSQRIWHFDVKIVKSETFVKLILQSTAGARLYKH